MKKQFRVFTAIIMIIAVMTSMCACASKSKASDLMEGVTAQEVTVNSEVNENSAELSGFAIRLFKTCIENGSSNENTLISPLSVLLALAMTANGAQGETLNEMETVLGLSTEELNEFAYNYSKLLQERNKEAGTLNLANSIWFTNEERFHVNQEFLQTNANYYGADLYARAFDDKTLKAINDWVNKKTNGMIPSILDQISPDAVMYLVNALAFEAEWSTPYYEYQVNENTFTTAEGTEKKVPFLNCMENRYLEDENSTGFIKYYKRGQYAFAAILPNEGVTPDEYLKTLTGEHLSEMLANAANYEVVTAIPKFKTEYSTELSGMLGTMGMNLPFDQDNADFGKLGTSEGGKIHIDRVLHKTFIEVTEKGTKAGAATVVEMTDGASAMPEEKPEPKRVLLTRPFIYMLIDCSANVPFFIGVMRNPEM